MNNATDSTLHVTVRRWDSSPALPGDAGSSICGPKDSLRSV